MHRVLIADDHAVVRKGLAGILAEHPDLELAGEAEDVPALLQKVRKEEWDLLLMDLNMPGGEGLETLRRVRAAAPELPVLILSIHPEDQLAARLLQAGADGYVNKEAAAEELSVAVRRVLRGQKYVSPDLASKLAEELGEDSGRPPHDRLSDREFQVLRLLGSGRTVSDIAEELTLSVKTVSTYRSRLLDKLEMENTAQIIRYALEHDLAE